MTALESSERKRLLAMSSIERMTAALRMGRIVRALAKNTPSSA